MADSDSIMQLGVAAARDGNREEARNLFRLLTRQEPDNAQAWLWLAGVADGRDERRAALERVVELDPDNEMAMKGLTALGVDISARPQAPAAQPVVPQAPVPPPTPEPAPSMRDRYDVDDDDPFAALDTLSEAMNEAPERVRRTEPAYDADDPYGSLDDLSEAMAGSSAVRRSSDAPPRSTSSSSSSSTTQRTPVSPSSSRRKAGRVVDDDTRPQRRRSPLLTALLLLLSLLLLVWLLNWLGLFDRFLGGEQVAEAPTTEVGAGATAGLPAADITTDAIPAATADPNAPVATADPNAPVATADPNAPVATADPNAAGGQVPVAATSAPLPPLSDLASAAPAPVAPGTVLESNGWTYNFVNPSYATNILGPVGGVVPSQGRFAVVLLNVINTSGSPQSILSQQFVLKDGQGRVYAVSPAASTAYVNTFGRGVAADLSIEDQVPADNLARSVALLFDVPPDGSNLTLFSSTNTSQGYQVLP